MILEKGVVPRVDLLLRELPSFFQIRTRGVIQKTEEGSQTKVQVETGPWQRVNFFLHDIMDIYI